MPRAAGVARAGARLPTSRTRRRKILRRTLIGSVIVHLILVALFLLVPRDPPPDTAPAEPGIAMQFETPRPKGAASDTPQPDAGEGIEAPTPSPVQSAPPATPSPPTPELPLAAAPPAPDVPLAPVPPAVAPPDAQALPPPPVPPPPDAAPAEATPPDAALPDTPAAEAPIAPAPETPEADMQVNAGPLAELFNLQPVPVPQLRPLPPLPSAPAPRPHATRPAPAFPTPREWAFTPAAPGGGSSPARGASRGLNLSFSPRVRGGGGQSSPDFFAPDAGPDWLNELHAWWDRHGYFPREAAEAGEQGTLSLHLMVNHDGRVAAARLTMQSGSVWLDQGALALFRDARLPALPPQTEKPQIPVDLTIRYILR
jgi:protein TonB